MRDLVSLSGLSIVLEEMIRSREPFCLLIIVYNFFKSL